MSSIETFFVPCASADLSGDVPRIGERSKSRGDALVSYLSRTGLLENPKTRVVCSGGVSGINDQMDRPRELTEASLLADYLIENGVDPHIIKTETRSKNAFGNIGYSFSEILNRGGFKREQQLGVVAPELFYKRLKLIFGAIGLEADALAQIRSDETESRPREFVGRQLTKQWLTGVSKPADLVELNEKNISFVPAFVKKIKA